MKRTPMTCKGCFHNAGMDVCMGDPVTCKENNYCGYRFHDFVQLAEYVTKNDIRCFYATWDDDCRGIKLEVRE